MTVGYDTQGMTTLLFSNHTDVFYLLETQHDPLAIILSWMLYLVLSGNNTLYLLIISYLTLYIAFYAIEKWRQTICITFGWFIYCVYFALLGMDQFKQVLSLSILLLSLSYLKKTISWKFLILVTIAVGFHITAIVGYAFLVLRWVQNAKAWIKAIIVIALIVLSIQTETLFSIASGLFSSGNYSDYFTGYRYETEWSVNEGTGLLAAVHLVPCVLPLFFVSKIEKQYRWQLSSMLLMAIPLRLLGYESQFLQRLYYEPALAIIFAYPLVFAGLEKRDKTLFLLVSTAVLLGYYYIVFSVSHGCVPYSISILE